MTAEDENSGTDAFLERSGPPTLDFPYHRDNYYMLEAYLPNRSWNGEEKRWMYIPSNQHDKDLEFVARAWKPAPADPAEEQTHGVTEPRRLGSLPAAMNRD